MDIAPTLTLAPAHPVAPAGAGTMPAAALPVDPATRTGCSWWVVTPADVAAHTAGHSSPHAA